MDDPYHYNLFQQIYCLSMATGIVSKYQGLEAHLQDELKKCLGHFLPLLTGNWALSWGPRVYKEKREHPDEGGPDNIWFAAVDDTQKVCVVAIAGTASNSWADLYQDFDVWEVVDFNAWVDSWTPQGIPEPVASTEIPDNGSTRPYCSKGSCVGVWNVLNNISTEANEGTRIDQYLSSLDPSYTIVVTGHSLGGAISPLVAYGLAKKLLTGDHKVKVLPSAGVSPGNEAFAAAYTAAFPKDSSSGEGEGYQVYNTDYYNESDIVPQAWSIDTHDDRNLHNILDKILDCDGDFRKDIEGYLNIAIGASTKSNIRYKPLPGQRFSGSLLPTRVESWDDVKLVMSTQHVLAYWDELGITEFVSQFDQKFRGRGM